MIGDFEELPTDAPLDADVCVIGAGPAGIAIAREFLGSGTRVLLVESGGLDQDDAVDGPLNDAENVGLALPTLYDGRTRAFGGATKLWPGQCVRLDTADFERRDWVPDSGWPIGRTDLDPFYDRAEAWFGMPAESSDDQAWRRFGMTPPPFDGLVHRTSMYTPFPDVGTHFRAEFAQSPNVRVLLGATVARIRTGPDGAAERAEIRTRDGRVGEVSARVFVLAGGGVENARMLLLSDLGNDHDVVGRYFQEHPTIWVDLDVDAPEALQRFYGRLGRRTIRYLPKIRLAEQVQRERRTLSAVSDILFDLTETVGVRSARELSSALQDRRRPVGVGPAQLWGAVRELDRVALGAYRRFVQGRPSTAPWDRAQLKILVEQAPHRDSRVTLSEQPDALGLPKARVDWRLTELDRHTTRSMTGIMDSELRRLGLARLRGPEWLDDDDWTDHVEEGCHHMGTTRMSTDPRSGVVDADCGVHGVAGLYACGSSVFPTGGYANPTLTIVALALRLADHVKITLARGARVNATP